jgi:hypothetical protein
MLDRGHVGGVHVAYHLDGRICRVWNDAGEEIEVEDQMTCCPLWNDGRLAKPGE